MMEPMTATFFDLVRAEMDRVEARMQTRFDQHHRNLASAMEHLLSSGGKRVRPALVLLTGAMLGADREQAITMAAAIELLHTATLVHDDLIDGSLLRRGVPTLNAQWTPAATVLTGDYVFARAAHLAAQTGSLSVMEAFARTLMTIVNGEITQLFQSDSGDLRKDYLDRIYAKTASLFELATEGAALLSESDGETTAAMKAYGYNLGIAFQIVDDVLDFVGEPDRVGKPVASDLRQGLITLPTLCYLDLHPGARRQVTSLRQQSPPEDEIEKLIHAIRDSEAVNLALDEARDYVATAEGLLGRMPDGAERDALYELGRYLLHRTL
jgi:geranylgeranyl pyrophosphate synthase